MSGTGFDKKFDDAREHLVLVADDLQTNVVLLVAHLKLSGYRTLSAYNGPDALKLTREHVPDLLMLDVNMPGMSGLEVCRQVKADEAVRNIPIIMVTANSNTEDIVNGLEYGADDYLIKPYSYQEMLARVRSILRIGDAQRELARLNSELDELNRNLEKKVEAQVQELGRMNRLRRFFSPQIVETIVSANSEDYLKDHRREITVVFLDLRNFTSFAESAGPDEVIQTIRELHHAVGPIIFRCRGTLERFTGDGMMVFLGDPEPMQDHALQALKMSMEIRGAVETLRAQWSEKGYELSLGIGACTGYASLGTIGFEGRLDYAALGSVTNLAARLCSRAQGGQILIAESTHEYVKDEFHTVAQGEISLKGFAKPCAVFEVINAIIPG